MSKKQEIIDWKAHPITREVFVMIKERIRSIQDDLGVSAGLDPLQDRFKVGALAAYSDFYFLDTDSLEETK